MADRNLIINADDFGASQAVNKAVVSAHRFGTVTSASLMTGGEGFAGAVEICKENRGLGVGLHFTLTQTRPVADPELISTLCDSAGAFFERVGLLLRLLSGLIRTEDVRTELEAQLRLADEAGVVLTHIDGHQHVHIFPIVFGLVADLAKSRGLALRIPDEERIRTNLAGVSGLKLGQVVRKQLIRPLCRTARRKSREMSIRTNDHFRSYFGLVPAPSRVGLGAYLKLIDGLKPGNTELMVHPAVGMGDERLWGSDDSLREDRGYEAETLMDPGFKSSLEASGVRLTNYGEL